MGTVWCQFLFVVRARSPRELAARTGISTRYTNPSGMTVPFELQPSSESTSTGLNPVTPGALILLRMCCDNGFEGGGFFHAQYLRLPRSTSFHKSIVLSSSPSGFCGSCQGAVYSSRVDNCCPRFCDTTGGLGPCLIGSDSVNDTTNCCKASIKCGKIIIIAGCKYQSPAPSVAAP